MLVQCTLHIGGTRLITIRLLASPLQLFLLKAVDFSLVFLSSSISTYQFLNLSLIKFVRYDCKESEVRHTNQQNWICAEAAIEC